MSAANATDHVQSSTSNSKKKKSKKKTGKGHEGQPIENGTKVADDAEQDNAEGEAAVLKSPQKPTATEDAHASDHEDSEPTPVTANGTEKASKINDHPTSDALKSPKVSDATERLDAMARERDALRAEVAELRKNLETITGQHEEETETIKSQLEETQAGKEHAESQYKTLLGKVNTIRAQLGERLKADAEELSQAREQIEQLEEQQKAAQASNESLQAEMGNLSSENDKLGQELSELRNRQGTSQSNWVKERDELVSREARARDEFETAKQAMQDWEVLAMEERSLRENLTDKNSELEEQLSTLREQLGRATNEGEQQSQTVDGLQRALQEIQEARKRELRELVETNKSQVEAMKKQLQAAEDATSEASAKLAETQKELERTTPFEKEVKEKNLLIGKLRHEAVILNDHLTKALRFLKKGKPQDNVDRQIVTNHFLHFLALDRSDPKKFQVLQLIAALLNWTEEEKERAGLARPGASDTSTLKIPVSPFRRSPSMPSVAGTADLMSPEGSGKESLAELWSDFLIREAQEAAPSESRRGSGMDGRRESALSPTSTKNPS